MTQVTLSYKTFEQAPSKRMLFTVLLCIFCASNKWQLLCLCPFWMSLLSGYWWWLRKKCYWLLLPSLCGENEAQDFGKKTVETPHKALNIKEENTFFTFTPRTFLQFLLLHVLWTRVLWNIAGLISESMGRKLRSLAASPCQTESMSYPVAQLCEDTPMRRHS